MIPTLPLRLRDRLARVILAAFHDAAARAELAALARDPRAVGWLPPGEEALAPRLSARACSAAAALAGRPLGDPAPALVEALDRAAALDRAHCYFEVHELLEPHWQRATGGARQALQGLIQVAVGWQHLANGNLPGARALLGEGSARLRRRRLAGVDFDGYARAVAAVLPGLATFDWARRPPMPRAGGA